MHLLLLLLPGVWRWCCAEGQQLVAAQPPERPSCVEQDHGGKVGLTRADLGLRCVGWDSTTPTNVQTTILLEKGVVRHNGTHKYPQI
jgi:hypothetical protein